MGPLHTDFLCAGRGPGCGGPGAPWDRDAAAIGGGSTDDAGGRPASARLRRRDVVL